MLFSIAIEQPKLGFNIKPSSISNQNLFHLKPFKTPLCFLPKGPKFPSSVNLRIDDSNYARNLNKILLKASPSTTDAIPTDDLEFETPTNTKKLKVVVKSPGRPRLVLKFIWMQKEIGIALDQMIPGHGTIPLSPYYFWPRKDAWEELKVLLEGKTWISPMQRVILLNQATDIINLWQESGGNIS